MKEIFTGEKNSEALRQAADQIRTWSGQIVTENSEAIEWGHSVVTQYNGTMLAGSLLTMICATVRTVFNDNLISDPTLLSGAALTFSQFIPFKYLHKKEATKKLV